MSTSDILSVVSLAIAFGGIIYAFGIRDNRLKVLEKDVNNLGVKYAAKVQEHELVLKRFDERLDRANEFRLLADQRVAYLEDRVLGEETASRLRGIPPHYTTNSEDWYSENSGINL